LEKEKKHYYKLIDVHIRASPVVELGSWIKPTTVMITIGDVEYFCKNMKDLIETFHEVDGHFKGFITDLMKMTPSIASIAL
jgi:hypothetical protein